MKYMNQLTDRYKHHRSKSLLGNTYCGKYAFVGIGNHSLNNLYPVLGFLHVPLKYICCKSADKLRLIERAYPNVLATTDLQEVLADEEVKGVFVSTVPQAHFQIATEVLKSGKALFVEKPPCQYMKELRQLMAFQKEYGSTVMVGLQKRNSPIVRILKRNLQQCKGGMCYNAKYLTGAYPEGDALSDLFIHPLDCITHLFGEAKVKCAEDIGGHTLLLVLEHQHATGILELSTGYSWSDAKEQWTINTDNGIYEMNQFESLTFQGKQKTLMGVPLEKIRPHRKVTTTLFDRNNFVPLRENNQIVSQGYFDTIKVFVDATEGNCKPTTTTFESMLPTYSLIETIRTLQKEKDYE